MTTVGATYLWWRVDVRSVMMSGGVVLRTTQRGRVCVGVSLHHQYPHLVFVTFLM